MSLKKLPLLNWLRISTRFAEIQQEAERDVRHGGGCCGGAAPPARTPVLDPSGVRRGRTRAFWGPVQGVPQLGRIVSGLFRFRDGWRFRATWGAVEPQQLVQGASHTQRVPLGRAIYGRRASCEELNTALFCVPAGEASERPTVFDSCSNGVVCPGCR